MNAKKIYYYKYNTKISKLFAYFSISLKKIINYIIKKHNISLIVLYNPSIFLINYCLKLKIKIIIDYTEWYIKPWPFSKIISMQMSKTSLKVDGIIAVSPFLYNFYKKKINTIFIPPLVNIEEKLNRIEMKKRNNYVFFAESISRKKERLDIIINSFAELQEFNLFVIGTSKEKYFKVYGEKKITNNIYFYEKKNHFETLNFVFSCDYMIFIRDINIKTKAGFSTKLAEGLTIGIPIIANHDDKNDIYIQNGYNGLLIDSINSASLKNAIIISKETKLNFHKSYDFSINNYVDAILKFFKDIH